MMDEVPARRAQTDTTMPTPEEKHATRANGLGDGEHPPVDARAVDRELDEVCARLADSLRSQRPDLFDASGRPKPGVLESIIKERFGKKSLTKSDILKILRK